MLQDPTIPLPTRDKTCFVTSSFPSSWSGIITPHLFPHPLSLGLMNVMWLSRSPLCSIVTYCGLPWISDIGLNAIGSQLVMSALYLFKTVWILHKPPQLPLLPYQLILVCLGTGTISKWNMHLVFLKNLPGFLSLLSVSSGASFYLIRPIYSLSSILPSSCLSLESIQVFSNLK